MRAPLSRDATLVNVPPGKMSMMFGVLNWIAGRGQQVKVLPLLAIRLDAVFERPIPCGEA